MKRVHLLVVGAVGFVGLSGIGCYAYASSLFNSNLQIESVATEAVVLDHNIPFYYRLMDTSSVTDLKALDAPQFASVKASSPLRGLVSMLPSTPDLSKKIHLSSSELTSWSQRAASLISDVFMKDSVAYNAELSKMNSVKSTVNASDVLPVDGGVRNIVWDSITVNNGTAKVSGSADGWASFGHWQNGAYAFASPHNEMNYTLTLKQSGETWKVTDLSWGFAPGSQP